MKILSIKFLNFRTFLKEEIIFDEKLSLIYGKNGAGKSSIVDAIGICLFGTKSSAFSRGKKEEEKNFLVGEDSPSKLELCFEFMGENYRIIRVLDKGKTACDDDFIEGRVDVVYKGTTQITTEIDSFIFSLLGVSRETFTKTIFSSQKDIEILSSGDLKSKKTLINNILGLNKLDELVDFNYKKTLNELKNKKKFTNDINENIDIDKIKNDKKNLSTQLSNHKKDFNILKENNKKFLDDSSKLVDEYKAISDKKDTFSKLSGKLKIEENNIKNNLDNLKQNEEKLSKISEYERIFNENKNVFDDLKNVEDSIKKLDKEKEKYDKKQEIISKNNELISKKNQLLDFNNSIFKEYKILDMDNFLVIRDKKVEENNKNNVKIDDLKDDLSKLKLNGINKNDEFLKLEKELNLIKKMNEKAKCPTCLRELGDEFSHFIKRKDNELQELGNQVSELRKNYAISNKKLVDLTSLSKSFSDDLDKINDNIQQLEKNNSNIDLLSPQISKNNLEIKEIGDIKFSIDDYNNLGILKKDLSEKQEKLLKIKGKIDEKSTIESNNLELSENYKTLKNKQKNILEDIKKLDYNEKDFLKKQEKYLGFIEKSKQEKELIDSKNEEIISLDKSIEKLTFEENRYEENFKKIEKINDEIIFTEFKIEIISDYKNHLFSLLKPRIEDIASSYFHKITYGKYSNIEINSKYEILIDSRNIKFYSGGERDLANLCLRLSLSQNLSLLNSGNSIDFMVLDEVLGSQDDERKEFILTALGELEDKFSQILLISHAETVRDFAKNLYEIKPNGEYKSKIIKN